MVSVCLHYSSQGLVVTSQSPRGISRHGLIYRFDAIAHGKFIHNFLGSLIKVHLPCIISSSFRDPDSSTALNICEVMEKILQETEQRKELNIYIKNKNKI